MKILILADDVDLIKEVVEKQGHAVIAETNDAGQVRDLILEYTPQIVFAEKSEQNTRAVDQLKALFSTVRFVVLGFQRGTTWTKAIRQALRTGKINSPWCPEIPEHRQIIFDPRYYSMCWAAKLKGPSVALNSENTAATEAMRLGRMLRTAKAIRERASLYAEAMSMLNGAEWQEITYRTAHKSFKGPAYAREQLGRTLGYLAHFIPSIDFDGLPKPIDEPGNLRFLRYHAPVEMHYALFGLALFGCDADLAKQLYRAAHWSFAGESSEDLTETTLALTGLAFTVHMIGIAHSTAIDWLLNPNTVTQLDEPRPRVLNRAIQTFRDWWGFCRVMDDKNRLGPIIYDLHANPTEPPFSGEVKIPDFTQFLEAMKASQETKPNQNQPPL